MDTISEMSVTEVDRGVFLATVDFCFFLARDGVGLIVIKTDADIHGTGRSPGGWTRPGISSSVCDRPSSGAFDTAARGGREVVADGLHPACGLGRAAD
jgi:hypothetical protein